MSVTPINSANFTKYQKMIAELEGKRALVIVVDQNNKVFLFAPPDTNNFEIAGWCLRAAGHFSNN